MDDYCAAWEAPYLRKPELVVPPLSLSSSSSSTDQQFYIRIVLEYLCSSAHTITHDDHAQRIKKTNHFWAPCNRLEPHKLPRHVISGVLSGMGVPAERQLFFLQKISDCANEIASAAHNKREKILPMLVSASVLVDSVVLQQKMLSEN